MRHVLALAFLLVPATALAQPITMQDGFAPLAAKVSPAVVNIMTDAGSVGSGVIISADGLVVTNHHVVSGAHRVAVALGEKKVLNAVRLGSDRESDIALLKLPAGTYPTLAWADSSKVRVGEFALAIGNPLGIGTSVSVGIVSAVGRGSREPEHYEDFIQTDAAVNKGNSGGALVNMKGELIGINSRIANPWGETNIGIAFAISSNLTKTVVGHLLKKGEAKRGWMGVSVSQTIDGYVVIRGVQANSPARHAGLRPNDVVLAVRGIAVDSIDTFLLQIARGKPGEKLEMAIVRGRERISLNVTLGGQVYGD